MSFRTILEINHDLLSELLGRDREQLLDFIRSLAVTEQDAQQACPNGGWPAPVLTAWLAQSIQIRRPVPGLLRPAVVPPGTLHPKPHRGRKQQQQYATANLSAQAFYESDAWRELRYRILKQQGRRCACCGRTPLDGVAMHVDHIKPRSKFPHLELVASNLQILCEDCNIGKKNFDSIAWADQAKGALQ